MLISTLYHHINADKYSNTLFVFKQHLEYIIENFNIVVPGDNLSGKDICLTFDDAYYDFYHYVYPLLKKHNIKVVLAVPTDFILDKCDLDVEKRLSILHDNTYKHKEAFCTYEELKEMSDSGLVTIASHTSSHSNLNETQDLEYEIVYSKKILQEKIGVPVDSLVFPFGKYNESVLAFSKKHYKYIFRIGNGVNKDFNGIKGVIYRVNGDDLHHPKSIFSMKNMLKYTFKSWIKSF